MRKSPEDGVELSPAQLGSLDGKWSLSWTPSEVAAHLAGIATPWCVVAGWALDLFRGGQTRSHADLEIAVPAANFGEIRNRFPGLAFDAVAGGRVWQNATADQLTAGHQTWLRDPASGNYLLDVFREPHDGDTWICRHHESIRFPYREIIRHTPDNIPYLAPELVLLFKAKHVRPKDQADFDATIPYLTAAQRETLTELLIRTHPEHRWLTDL